MAATQNSKVVVKLQAEASNTITLGTVRDQINLDYTQGLEPGTGAGQANVIYRATRTLNASATEDLDLSGTALTDGLGASVALTKVKAILVHAAAANTTFSLFVAANDAIPVKPGGTLVLTAPALPGMTVVPVLAGATDLLTVTNSAGSTPVSYDIVVIGV